MSPASTSRSLPVAPSGAARPPEPAGTDHGRVGTVSRLFAIPPWQEVRRRLIPLVVGLVLCGVAFGCIVKADLGLDPWDVLHQGISDRTGIPIGTVWPEEAAYRATLGTVAEAALGPTRGRVLQAMAFGLWHIVDARLTGQPVIGTVLLTGSNDKAKADAAAAKPAATPVSVAKVEERDATIWDEFSGRLEAVEQVEVRSRVAGAIQEIRFREGALVHKDDVLVVIDPALYAAEVARAEAALKLVQEPGFYDKLTAQTAKLVNGLAEAAREAGVTFCADSVGGMFGMYFSANVPSTYGQMMAGDKERFNRFFHGMLDEGVYFAPAMFEAGFVSAQHDDGVIAETVEAARRVFKRIA